METKPQAQSSQKTFIIPLYGWLILACLLVWNVWVLLPNNQTWVELTYSDLLNQVNAGNVSQVTFSGSDISGTLVHPVSDQNGTPVASYTVFHSRFPQVAGDTLVSLLVWHHVQIDVNPISTRWLQFLWTNGLPAFLLIFMLVILIVKAIHRYPGLFTRGVKRTQKYTIQHPQLTFEDVGGEEEAKNYLREIVDSIQNPEEHPNVVRQAPRGILLVGQPGTGKTLLACALAGEAGVPLLTINGSDFCQMNLSDFSDLSNQAETAPLSIVLIENLEAANHANWDAANSTVSHESPFSQRFAQLDGSEKSHPILLLGETSHPENLDPAWLNAGQFDHQVMVGLPDRVGREDILKIHTKNLHLAKNVNLGVIARTTTGLSGADLATLCHQAALQAVRKNSDQVVMADFEEALDQILLTASRKLILNEEERRIVAYHQAGHVLVAWLTPGTDPIRKVSFLQDHPTSGFYELPPLDEHNYFSKSSLLARLAVLLAGRAAEEVIIGEVTTGSEYDLIQATRLARRMITRWGMGQMGPIAFDTSAERSITDDNRQLRDYSEATAERIDQDVQELLATSYTGIHKLMNTYRVQLEDLVEALIRDETIDQEEISHILGARPLRMTDEGHASVIVTDLEHPHFRT